MPQKTRSGEIRTSGVALQGQGPVADHLVCVNRWNVPAGVDYVETISYDGGRRYHPYKRCLHSYAESPYGFPAEIAGWCHPSAGFSHQSVIAGEPEVEDTDSVAMAPNFWGETHLGVTSNKLALARQGAITKVLAGFNDKDRLGSHGTSDWNAVEALFELKDTKDTIGPLINFIKWLRKLPAGRVGTKIVNLAAKKGPTKMVIHTLAQAAQAYLWYSFGVEPSVRDVQELTKELSSGSLQVKGRKNRFVEFRKGQTLTSHYSCKPSRSDILGAAIRGKPQGSNSVDRVVGYGLGWIANRWDFRNEVPTGVIVKTDEYKGCAYAEVAKTASVPEWKVLARNFHWACPVGAAFWAVTPFSFLVDWAFDVGDYLERLERRATTRLEGLQLGPVWIAERRSECTYYPTLLSFEAKVADWKKEESPQPSRLGVATIDYQYAFGVKRICKDSTFIREPAGRLPVARLPGVQRRTSIKAYQISSGMALLAQFAGKRV